MKRSTFITWDQLKVGSLILLAIAILTVAVVKLGQSANLFTRRYSLVVFLPNTSGLRVGGQVTVAGLLAGVVKSIDFLPPDADTTRNLKVVIEIDESLREQVRADSRAKLRTMGLLGDKMLDINPGTPRFSPLRSGDTLRVDQSLDYEAVIAQAAGAVGDMVDLTHDLRQITTKIVAGEGTIGRLLTDRALYDDFSGTLRRTNQMLARLSSSNGTVGKLLDDPALYRNVVQMVSSVDSLVAKISTSQGTMMKFVNDTTLYANFVGITVRADSLVRGVNTQLSTGNGLAAKMLNDPALYEQLLKAVTELNAILADVRKNPGRYTKGVIKVF